MASTLDLLRRLTNERVDYILVGGMAAVAHGSSVVTEDVDVLVRFDLETMTGVIRALAPVQPKQRMSPNKPPLGADASQFVGYKNLYLETQDGVLDLLGSIVGVGDFEATAVHSTRLDLGGFQCRVIGIDDLITCKRTLGRPKDLRVVLELERVVRARLSGTHL
ncbi:MAG: hypothetical protein K1X64_05725 [Myxococcaceae bacterium]|nr:hypothetical protein [Myxococcaceae bacterium]